MNGKYGKYLAEGELAGERYSLVVPREIMSGRLGFHAGSMTGASQDFRDFREYNPGDDLRRIDWGAYGRSDKLIVKLYREEIDPHVDILIDCSKSMAVKGTEKARAVLGLAALIASAARKADCSCTPWMAADGCRIVENGADRPSAWQNIEFDFANPLGHSLAVLPPKWRRRGIRVLISDLLFPGDPARLLAHFTQGASATHIVQVLGRADADPPLRGNLKVEDAETGETVEIFFDDHARRRYAATLAAHQQNWHSAAIQTGAKMITLISEEIVSDWKAGPLEEAGLLGAA